MNSIPKFFLLVSVLSIPFYLIGGVTGLAILPGLPISALAAFCPMILSGKMRGEQSFDICKYVEHDEVPLTGLVAHIHSGSQVSLSKASKQLDIEDLYSKKFSSPTFLLFRLGETVRDTPSVCLYAILVRDSV